MRRRFRHADDTDQVDLTPMLDLVFILLIFFIVTAVFLDETAIIVAETPETEAPPSTERSFLVQLDEQDRAFVDGEPVALKSVLPRIQTLRAQAPEASVLMQADANSSINSLVSLKDDLDAAAIPVSIKVTN